MRARWMGLLVAVVLAASSCSGGTYNSAEHLRDSVNHFNDAIRWGQHFRAAEWVQADHRNLWLSERRDWGDDLRIADYEVLDTQIGETGRTATVRVSMDWYRLSVGEVESSMLTQQWVKEGRTWVMASEEVTEGAPL